MRDKVSISRVARLHPKIRIEAQQLIDKSETLIPSYMAIRVIQGLRTFEEQQALYNQPKDGKDNDGDGKIDEADEHVTNAKAGSSYHNYGLALDFAILYDKDRNGSYETLSWDTVKDEDKDGIPDWKEVANTFKAAGWTWGGDFRSIIDKPHVEKTFGRDWKSLLALKQRGYVDPQGYVTI